MDRYCTLVRRRAEQEGAEYVETGGPGDARVWAMRAAQAGRPVIIVGGDGSLNEVVNGLLRADRRVPLGIIAAGSGNDYAWYTLQLPRDPLAAIERAFHGQPVPVDVGLVNGYYFANAFSVGIDADIAVAAGELKKVPFLSGTRLYYVSIMRQLLFGYHRCPWLKICLDEGQQGDPVEKRYVLMAVTIGPTYGAGFRIAPKAVHTDGFFDICTIDYTPLLRALQLLPIAKKGEHAGLPEVRFYRARTAHIESKFPVNIQMDGETSSAVNFHAEIVPQALLVRT
jgi:diacylglycerol kinase (ATP)